jgi:hypothetical protein
MAQRRALGGPHGVWIFRGEAAECERAATVAKARDADEQWSTDCSRIVWPAVLKNRVHHAAGANSPKSPSRLRRNLTKQKR